MKLAEYQLIIKFIEEQACRCDRSVLCDVLDKFIHLGSYDTIFSIFLNHVQRMVRLSFNSKMKGESSNLHYQLYKEMNREMMGAGAESHGLVKLSNKFIIPPGLMARQIIEQFLHDELRSGRLSSAQILGKEKGVRGTVGADGLLQSKVHDTNTMPDCDVVPDSLVKTFPMKQTISAWIKDPHLITDEILREQVLQCISYDVCYGPINDAIRHSVGLEFEIKLRNFVIDMKLPFLDENDLRKRGYDKTPDIKLEIPIAVRGHPVCWIESKASFGDLETHSEYLQGQYLSYWNRFGPGLVIYWFGFIDEIFDEMKRQGILTMDKFPILDDIVLMAP